MTDKNWVVVDPANNDEIWCDSEEQALAEASEIICNYDDELNEPEVDDLKRVYIAKVTHRCREVSRMQRPPDSELDSTGRDFSGMYWGDNKYLNVYDMQPVEEGDRPVRSIQPTQKKRANPLMAHLIESSQGVKL